jgi:diadenosine tetraphosphate (Ap4A) HIT family hydrolase
MNCRFCSIDNKRNVVIEEFKYTWIIMSNPRLMPGHLLVIPKKHVEKLSELSEKEVSELISAIIRYQEIILNKYTLGCDVRIHTRTFMKESELKVNHLHVHLHPRELYDELYKNSQVYEKDIFKDLSDGEISKFSKLYS